jgi:molecular chaperone GrpE
LSDDNPVKGPEDPVGVGTGAPEPKDEGEQPDAAAPAEHSQVEGTLEEVIEAPPTSGPAEAYLRRAQLAEDRLQEVLAAYRKLKADNEGHRERSTRNIERRFDQRRERLLLKFIDILDNLDRALEAAEKTYAGEPLIEGLILVRTQLLQTLQEEGLERIPVIGLPYDPNFSEVVQTMIVHDPDHENLVVKELMRGYRLNGRVARASRVAVGRYEEPKAPEPGAEPRPANEEPSLEDIVASTEPGTRPRRPPAPAHAALEDPDLESPEPDEPGDEGEDETEEED